MDAMLQLPQSTEYVLAQHAEVIRALGKRMVRDVIEIGRRLTDAKELAGHGNWLPWLDREFGWADETAFRFIRVAELSKQIPQVVDFDLPVSALYLLAAPSTSDEAREEVIGRAESGERLNIAQVKKMIEDAAKKDATAFDEKMRRQQDRAEAARAKLQDQYDAEVRRLRDELKTALTPDAVEKAIDEAMAPMKKKLEQQAEKIERLTKPKIKDEHGVSAAAVAGALRHLSEMVKTVSPEEVIQAQKIVAKLTEQSLRNVMASEIENAKVCSAWLRQFTKLTETMK